MRTNNRTSKINEVLKYVWNLKSRKITPMNKIFFLEGIIIISKFIEKFENIKFIELRF